MKPLISIVIAVYNDAEFIEQAVDSAVNQTYDNLEIILVDDGSDETTKSILQKIKNKVTILITQENQGQSKARNVGVENANGEYILILDSDDYFESTFCEKALVVFKGDEKIKLVSCIAKIFYQNNIKTELYTPLGGDVNNFLYTNGAIGNSLFKRIDFLNSGGYDENMKRGYEDWEFFIRLLKNGGNCFVINEPLFNYRKKEISTTSKSNKYKYEILHYIFTKHKDLYFSVYNELIYHLLKKCETEEISKRSISNTLDYRLGKILLLPIRYINSFFKK